MLQLFAILSGLAGLILVVSIALIYIAVGECDLIYRMGEVATFTFLATFGLVLAAVADASDEVEEEDDDERVV